MLPTDIVPKLFHDDRVKIEVVKEILSTPYVLGTVRTVSLRRSRSWTVHRFVLVSVFVGERHQPLIVEMFYYFRCLM